MKFYAVQQQSILFHCICSMFCENQVCEIYIYATDENPVQIFMENKLRIPDNQ